MSSEFKDLIWRLLSPESAKRPSLEDIKAHQWLQNKKLPLPWEEEKSDCEIDGNVSKSTEAAYDQSEDLKSSTEASTAEDSSDNSECEPSDEIDLKVDEVTEVRTSFKDCTPDTTSYETEEAKAQNESKL